MLRQALLPPEACFVSPFFLLKLLPDCSIARPADSVDAAIACEIPRLLFQAKTLVFLTTLLASSQDPQIAKALS